ncbi:HAD family hydrolase [Anaerotalea alkaliphila]|uniref:HAD family hydrolase n=1 Tax=Anaerotalea alkaliphila TaxID=2662126 RepID=A0A7X5HU65_9FIRM|nr:HAD family hydrolase [Anaerotalea alkaliphila]NDL66740.1 HAD family hydrolase [Anaerotalea alkaliphila]
MYQNYVFSFYGTLVDIKTNEEKPKVWEKMSLYYGYFGAVYNPEEMREVYEKTVKKFLESNKKSKHPEIDIEDVFYKLFKVKEVQPKKKVAREAARVFRMLTTEKIGLYEGVGEALQLLRDKGKKLYLLTNAQSKFVQPELKLLGIEQFFDGIYCSSDYGVCKPSETIFNKLLQEEGLKKKETLVVGNEYSMDIKGANNAGIDALFIRTNLTSTLAQEEPCKFQVMDGTLVDVVSMTGTR